MAEQKIGKYRILERIGRGGMGMIFKAHDPVLDRLVALKVISPEIEVTDELRARFFREAQACAKLNHPNIVTVYDLGEDDGRLFIVMELLEGQELRRLIVPGTPLTLEDKLSVMTQVCAGLHYAHQKGIVHRDMKPGNVFLLGAGQVKILDFGIAHMATTADGLTRTGLIMGTLRYISPEQVRGRSDHRSDMFSVGSVFYELLTLRPAFTGEDPMQLLDQLRSVEPPSPSEIDAGIPSELTAIVQRAMRKEPAERYRDLEEMRAALEQVQRAVSEERLRVAARVRAQRGRLVQLQADAVQRLGPSEHPEIPSVEERKGLVAVQALERTLATRIAALEGMIAEADAVEPAVQRAEDLLAVGRVEEAVAQFEAVVAETPGHPRGREGLRRARAVADAQWRGRRGVELTEQARAALAERRYALCLEILKRAADLTLPPDVVEQVRSLREQAVAEQDALHRRRQDVEDAPARPAELEAEPVEPTRVRLVVIAGTLIGLVLIGIVGLAVFGPDRRHQPARKTARVAEQAPQPKAAVDETPAARPSDAPTATDDAQLPPRTATEAPTAVTAPTKAAGPPKKEVLAKAKVPAAGRAEVAPAPPPTSAGRSEVDKLASRVDTARRAAEQAAAAYWAPQALAAARAREQLAVQARERSDLVAAARLLAEAESDYRALTERARAAADAEHRVSALKERVAESRAAAVTGRAEAIAAQAARLARDDFDAAEAAHREADDLDRRRDFAAAVRAYEAATVKYREAGRRAQAR